MNAKTFALLPAIFLVCTGAHAQPKPAFNFIPQVWTGATIGGYAFDANTKVDNVVLSDSGAVAFTAHRENNGTGRDETAVFTKERLVAKEGQVIDGKTIVRLATAVVAVNNAGNVAFEALYLEPRRKQLHGGVFVDDHFATEFLPSPAGGATEFQLADDGTVHLRNGAMPPKGRRPWLTAGFFQAVHGLERTLINRIPRGSYADIWGGSLQVGDVIIWDKVTGQPLPTRSEAAAPKLSRACPAPAFPIPAEWVLGGDGGGPVAAHLFEQGNKSRPYESAIYGHVSEPARQVQFSDNCRPLAIAIIDPANDTFEIKTPSGLLTYRQADGAFAMPGFFQRVTSASFLPNDATWMINRRGQIVLRVATDDGIAVLLAKPSAADR